MLNQSLIIVVIWIIIFCNRGSEDAIYIFGIGERLLPVELNPVKMNSIKLTNNNPRWNEVKTWAQEAVKIRSGEESFEHPCRVSL